MAQPSIEDTRVPDSMERDLELVTDDSRSGGWPQESSGSIQAIRVLLAEDNPTNQMFAREVISRQGWICEVVDNGRQAVESIKKTRFDIVLMDCQMPEMDGFTATAAIRRMEQETSVPVSTPIIALTANAIKGDRERCLLSGMDAYLPKPFAPKSLIELIRKLVDERNQQADVGTLHTMNDAEKFEEQNHLMRHSSLKIAVWGMQNSRFRCSILF